MPRRSEPTSEEFSPPRTLATIAVLAALASTGVVHSPPAYAISEAAAPSLILTPGARANAMGQTGVTMAQDATAMYWNPALLAGLEGVTLTLMPRNQLIPELASGVYFW